MKETRKKSLGFYFYPGKRGFHIVAMLKDDPEALYSILGLLHDHLQFAESSSYTLGDGTAIWSGFGVSLLRGETEGKLERLIGRSPFVLECEVNGSDRGLLVDSFHTGIDVVPDRPGVVLPVRGVVRIYDRLIQTFGSGGRVILHEEGVSLGKSTGRYLNARLGKGDLKWKVKALFGLYRLEGWGAPSLEVERPGTRFRVMVHDHFECSNLRKEREGCDFTKGHLAGAISGLSGKEFEGEEVKCRLRGDPVCEFVLTRKES